jgi:aryl-alcohol dehydrogenase-like predicted oxidoreductase
LTNLILGTANFGNQYGIANRNESISSDDLRQIINWAQNNGINQFDSAMAYGDSHSLLKMHLDHSLEPLIDSKLDEKSCQSKESILESANKIRNRLGVSQLSVLYLHNESLLTSPLASEISSGLREVLNQGLAKRIGVSVYSEEAILQNKKVLPELTVFQVPENIWDRRLVHSKKVLRLSEDDNSFNIRSIFLQGLLLMQPADLPTQLRNVAPKLQEFIDFAHENSLTTLELCTAYARSISWASGIIVGVASLGQLKEIQKASALLPEGWGEVIPRLPIEVVDPRRWG